MLAEKTNLGGSGLGDPTGNKDTVKFDDECKEPLLKFGVAEAPKAKTGGLFDVNTPEEIAFSDDFE